MSGGRGKRRLLQSNGDRQRISVNCSGDDGVAVDCLMFAPARREVSRSTGATSFPLQPSRGPGLPARALRVVCTAQLAH